MSTHANLVNTPIPNHNNIAIGECLSAWDDALLVSAAKAGDRSAFVELYERHSRKVLPTIYRITKNREDAEDAFQDAVLRAFVHIKSFEGRANSSFKETLRPSANEAPYLNIKCTPTICKLFMTPEARAHLIMPQQNQRRGEL